MKIEPALSAEDWKAGRFESRENGSHATIVRRDPDGVSVSEWAGGPECETSPAYIADEAIAPAIAFLNDDLPDSDPRKITREMIVALRNADTDWGKCEEIADALESYLPPEKA